MDDSFSKSASAGKAKPATAAGRPPSPGAYAPAAAGAAAPSGGEPSRPRGGLSEFTTRQSSPKVLLGSEAPRVDPRKYRYDAVRGQSSQLAYELTKDDRMSATEAGAKLHAIHVMHGLAGENEAVLAAHDRAMFLCHTVNGSSTLNPGRSKFFVPGVTRVFDFADVRNLLGVDIRRFFRAFADDVAAANKVALESYNTADPVTFEVWSWITSLAVDKGLQKYPWLVHDSADACLGLSHQERAAVARSKVGILGSVVNSADRMFANSRVQSADKYDSTTGDSL